MTEAIFQAARKAFGKDVYKAWPRVIALAEWALWDVWNTAHGPLNRAQREYAVEVICAALAKCEGHPNPWAAYYAWLRPAVNHEKVYEGFKRRQDEYPDAVDVDVFQELVA